MTFKQGNGMSYVKKNLISGEVVEYTAKIHWLIFLPALICFVTSIFLMGAGGEATGQGDGSGAVVFGVLLFFVSLYIFLKALISKITTELVITNKRVIAKVGLIRRETIELNHSKVESYQITQTLIGRILGFGTVIINGTGGGKTPIPNIDAPMKFRNHAMEVIDNIQKSA